MKPSFIAILAFAFGLLASASLQAQTLFNGHLYQLTTTAESWTAAENEAVALGGHLVTINNQAEQNFITNTYALNYSKPLWIGFTDQAVEGTFVWSSGEPVTYTNWQPGEPSNSGGIENYVVINSFYALNGGPHDTWNDVALGGVTGNPTANVNGPYFGIIERSVPEPGTYTLLAAGAVSLLGFAKLRRRKA